MDEDTRRALAEALPILCCPACRGDLLLDAGALRCPACALRFAVEDEIPLMFLPNDWTEGKRDVTERMRAFYEETPFPNYDDFDSVASLVQKARAGRFAKLLDDQIPPGTRILECGCGTGQLSSFLSVANRSVFATDMCRASLELGQAFKRRNGLDDVHFLQMNLFRPVFRPGSFDLVISNGVLHHTSDPLLAFRTIATLVRPGGYLLVGLYHRYGRLVTDLRRVLFRLSGDRFTFLDPNLRDASRASGKRRAWFMDQYRNPHESKHTIGEVIDWLEPAGLCFVKSVPRTRPFRPLGPAEALFEAEAPGSRFERLLAELAMIRGGSREGGFFTVIAQRPIAQRPPTG